MQTSRFYKMRWKVYCSAYKGMPQVKNEAGVFLAQISLWHLQRVHKTRVWAK